MAQTPRIPHRFITGADIEVNKAEKKLGVKATAQPGAEPEAEPVEEAAEETLAEMNMDELRAVAADLEIEGRSSLNKQELIEAIEAAE